MSMYLQETLRIVPGSHATFGKAFESAVVPAMRTLGAELVGIWKHSSIKGDPHEVIAIWRLQDWSHAQRVSDAAANPDHALGRYAQDLPHIQERSALLLRQRASTAALQRLGGARPTQFCFHETMYIEPGKEHEYVRAMELQLGPSMVNIGLRMVGEFQPMFESGKIINLWAIEGDFESMVRIGKTDEDTYLDGAYWMEIGISLRKRWRSVWLLPMGITV